MTKQILRWLFLLVLVAAAVWYGWANQEVLASLRQISLLHLAALFVLTVAAVSLEAVQFKVLIGTFGLRLDFKEWYGLSVCNCMYNYLLPAHAGTGARALYLKRMHRLSYAHFGAFFAGSNVLFLNLAGVAGFVASLVTYLRNPTTPNRNMTLVFALLLALCVGGALALGLSAKLSRLVPFEKLREILGRMHEGLELFPQHARAMALVSALRLTQFATVATAYFIVCSGLGADLQWTHALTLRAAGAFGVLLPLTPASLGVSEGLIAFSGRYVGLATEKVLLTALIQRAAAMIVIFVMGTVFSHLLSGLAASVEASEALPENECT